MIERGKLLPHPDGVGLDRHIISFLWDEFDPHLLCYNTVSRKVEEISLDRLALAIGEEKECVGRFDDDGYHPCPRQRPVNGFSMCKDCMAPWVPVQKCVFEPQCNGDRCDHPEFCGRKHYVYLASFGNLIKVGMTGAHRLRERAIEQGADAVRPIFECRDRREARTLEKETSKRFKIPQEIRIKRIAQTWTSRPSKESMANVHEHYLHRIARWREPMSAELMFLDRYPIDSLPRTAPDVTATGGLHRGEILGIKGRFMMFRPEMRGDVRLLDLSDLPARSVRALDVH
jgi:hypothetical protein